MVASCRFMSLIHVMCVLRQLRVFWYTCGGFGFTLVDGFMSAMALRSSQKKTPQEFTICDFLGNAGE